MKSKHIDNDEELTHTWDMFPPCHALLTEFLGTGNARSRGGDPACGTAAGVRPAGARDRRGVAAGSR